VMTGLICSSMEPNERIKSMNVMGFSTVPVGDSAIMDFGGPALSHFERNPRIGSRIGAFRRQRPAGRSLQVSFESLPGVPSAWICYICGCKTRMMKGLNTSSADFSDPRRSGRELSGFRRPDQVRDGGAPTPIRIDPVAGGSPRDPRRKGYDDSSHTKQRRTTFCIR
jgi:hypothetical protein